MVSSYADLDRLLESLDPLEPFPLAELGTPRGRQGTPKASVTLPHGWLDDRDDLGIDAGAEIGISGG
jgi:hypothetical protein